MRKFTCSPFGNSVDLDDPETYSHLPDDVSKLDNRMFQQIGYAYCYMNFFWDDLDWDKFGQKQRVEQLIKKYCSDRKDNWDKPIWFKEQVFIFEDEIENMC